MCARARVSGTRTILHMIGAELESTAATMGAKGAAGLDSAVTTMDAVGAVARPLLRAERVAVFETVATMLTPPICKQVNIEICVIVIVFVFPILRL